MSVEGWKLRRLDEIGEICSGSTPSTNNLSYWDGDITWVTPNDLSKLNTPYLITSSKKITQQGLKSCSAQIVPIGSIILSSRAPIGYLAISLVDCCTNQGCKSFNLNPEYDSEFVYYNLKYNINKIKNLGEGTTFAEISKTALSKIQISFLENKQEQTQIATILSTIDRAIEQTEALITKQQRIKTGLMQDLLTKGIDENGNIRSEETHKFKDSPLGRIPVEWEVENYSEGCKRVSVGIATSTTKHFKDKGVPLIRNQNVLSGSFSLDDLLFISREFDEINKNKRLKSGDLVTMRTGYPGRTAIADKKMEGWQTFTTLISTPDSNKYLPEFMCILLNSFICRHQILGLQGGGAQQNLNVGWIVGMKIVKPLISEQIKIVKIIQSINEYIDILADSLNKLRCNKTGLMQDLLTGKVRVIELIKERETDNL